MKQATKFVEADERSSRAIQAERSARFAMQLQKENHPLQLLVNQAKRIVVSRIHYSNRRAEPQQQTPRNHIFVETSNKQVHKEITSSMNSTPNQKNQDTRKSQGEGTAMVELEWSGAANAVEVRFEVDGWSVSHHMTFLPHTHTWVLRHVLPSMSRVQFKFVVDGKWQTHPHYSTCQDNNGNTNNVITVLAIQWKFQQRHQHRSHQQQASTNDKSDGHDAKTTTTLHQCHSVSVCSQLDEWVTQQAIIPSLDDTGCCYRTGLILPGDWSGPFQFKFVVDGEWVVNPIYPITCSNSFQNNVLHVL